MSRKILLLGEDSRVLLALLRSLGRGGFTVDVAGCKESTPAFKSRYVNAWHHLPLVHDDGFPAALLQLLSTENFCLLIPAGDRSCLLAHCLRADIESHCSLALPSTDAFETMFDKNRTAMLANELAIPVPTCRTVTSVSEANKAAANMSWPIFIKPLSSYRSGMVGVKEFVMRADKPSEFEALVNEIGLSEETPYLLQQAVSGTGVGVEVLACAGEILYAFQHQRIHETSGHGSTYRKSVPLDEALLSDVAKMVEKLQLSGVAMFEFRLQIDSGEYYLIEVNGRFWGSLALAVASGADFPKFLVANILDGVEKFDSNYISGVHARCLFDDARMIIRHYLPDKASGKRADGWALSEQSAKHFTPDLWRIFSRRHVFDSFAKDDPAPFFKDLYQLVAFVFRRLQRG